jgi:hypothetical protein
MTRRRSILVTLASMLVTLGLGCTGTGGLSEREAKEVLQQRFDEVNVGLCRLSLVKPRADGSLTIIDDSGSATACFDQVVKAGFGRRGDCRDTDGPTSKGTCIDRTVVPAGGARAHKDGFLVPCGTLSLIGVDSMKKVGKGIVSVTYRRTFDAKPVADQMGNCREGELFMPDRGTRTKSLTLSRQIDGRWVIDHLEPFGAVHVL